MNTAEFDEELRELENRMERLRALYEQYFMGIERIEPAVARKDVDRRMNGLRRIKQNNTARRFKLQTLIQRYNTLQQHWVKICRRIENGTYTRHLERAERRFGADAVRKRWSSRPPVAKNKAASEPPNSNAPSERAAPKKHPDRVSAPQQATPKPQAERATPSRLTARDSKVSERASAPRTSLEASSGISDGRIRSLYNELLQAKKSLNQRSALSEAALAKSLRESEAKLRKRHGGRTVDFRVAVQDGKVILKPVVK